MLSFYHGIRLCWLNAAHWNNMDLHTYRLRVTLIHARISNHNHYQVCSEITDLFPKFNGAAVEVWEWIIPHFNWYRITYPCWDYLNPYQQKGVQSYKLYCISALSFYFIFRWYLNFEKSGQNQWDVRIPLHWRHNDQDGVSNHQPHGCLLNRLFRRRSKKTSKLRVTGLIPRTKGQLRGKCFHLMTSSCQELGVTKVHCWPRVRNIFHLGHKLGSFVWLIYFQVFCENVKCFCFAAPENFLV